jgi:hypothetical protein
VFIKFSSHAALVASNELRLYRKAACLGTDLDRFCWKRRLRFSKAQHPSAVLVSFSLVVRSLFVLLEDGVIMGEDLYFSGLILEGRVSVGTY